MKHDWEQAKEIFVNAIGLAPDERLPFVESECSGDSVLFEEVTSLLDSYEDDSFLETPATRAIAETLLFDGPSSPPEKYWVITRLFANWERAEWARYILRKTINWTEK